MKYRFLVWVAVFIALLTACSKNDEPLISSNYIRLDALQMPDTVYIDSITNEALMNVTLRCSVENSCWTGLSFVDSQINDSTFAFAAVGLYISQQSCEPIPVGADTVIIKGYTADAIAMQSDTIAPYFSKRFYFNYYSLGYLCRTDKVVVASYRYKLANNIN